MEFGHLKKRINLVFDTVSNMSDEGEEVQENRENREEKERPATQASIVRMVTLALVAITGVGNFAATKHADATLDKRIEQGMDRISALYEKLQTDRARQSTVDKLIVQIDEIHNQVAVLRVHQDEMYYKFIGKKENDPAKDHPPLPLLPSYK